MSAIIGVRALEILDSRGCPTIEVEVKSAAGVISRASIPSGASTGKHEVIELRDEDQHRYAGKGVQKAITVVEHDIQELLVGLDTHAQSAIDGRMIECDGTPNKSRFGGNAMLAVSIAVCKLAALEDGIPLYSYIHSLSNHNQPLCLPVPYINIINGGAHANNSLSVQEFMIVPHGFDDYLEAIHAAIKVYQQLKKQLHDHGFSTAVGDEGGFAPPLSNDRHALEYLIQSIEQAGYQPHTQISLALDIAATELIADQNYVLQGKSYNKEAWLAYWLDLTKQFPISSIEDICAEDDWSGWEKAYQLFHPDVQLVGDDIFVTNTERLKQGIDPRIADVVLVKPNQIGTVTETLETIDFAQSHGIRQMVSHRSGETNDGFISDLAVGVGCGQIKLGAPCRGERIAKYNQLIRIHREADIPYGQPSS